MWGNNRVRNDPLAFNNIRKNYDALTSATRPSGSRIHVTYAFLLMNFILFQKERGHNKLWSVNLIIFCLTYKTAKYVHLLCNKTVDHSFLCKSLDCTTFMTANERTEIS